MRYLRMLSNSMVAALVASAYMVTLVLQLNPTEPLSASRVVPIAMTVGVFYAVHLTVIFYIVLVLRQLFARELFSPGWVSVGVLTWLVAVSALGAAGLMWANLQTFELVLEPSTVRQITNGSIALVVSAACLVFVALLRAHMGAAARPVWAVLFAAVVCGSVVAPLAARGHAIAPPREPRPIALSADVRAESSDRVTIIAVDGASLDFITGATAQGRLPNFGRLLDGGAVVHLATVRPTSAEAVWAAVATGKLPQKNGVRSANTYRLPAGGDPILLLPDYCFSHILVRFGFLREQPHDSRTWRTHPLWSIAGAAGVPVGVVGWPLTHPASEVRGYLVSDFYHRLVSTPSGIEDASAVFPADAQSDALRAAEAAGGADTIVSDVLDARYQAPAKTDRTYERVGRELSRLRPAQLTMIRYQSLDVIGHYFLRYAVPTEFGDVTEEERRRFGSVLEAHYDIVDAAIGDLIASLGSNDLLIVLSGYGMEPMGVPKRILERVVGDPDLSGTHEAAPDGFLMAYGGPVSPGHLTTRASLVDVVPTVLYFLGLPIGRDMDGSVRNDLFQREFTDARPITFIPTYEHY